MSITVNQPYVFHTCLFEEYKQALSSELIKDNDFYFVSDKNILFIGKEQYQGAIETVSGNFPENPAPYKIYFKPDTMESKYHNGSGYVTISSGVSNTLDENTDIGKLVTAGAIRSYITTQIGNSTLLNDVSYDSSTGNFTFTYADKTTKIVNTPVENFLQNAVYDQSSHILTLTMQAGNNIEINLSDLFNNYVGSSTNTIVTSIDGNIISGIVNLSPTQGNNLTVKSDGLFSAPTWQTL